MENVTKNKSTAIAHRLAWKQIPSPDFTFYEVHVKPCSSSPVEEKEQEKKKKELQGSGLERETSTATRSHWAIWPKHREALP